MKKNKIAIGSDHAGFQIKQDIIEYLRKKDFVFYDFGTFTDKRADYPDYAHPVGIAIENDEFDIGIVVCGSGNGVNMVVNKYQNVRSALCWKVEVAHLARLHNDANICAIPARFVEKEDALKIVEEFLITEFEGGRHLHRINKIGLFTKRLNS